MAHAAVCSAIRLWIDLLPTELLSRIWEIVEPLGVGVVRAIRTFRIGHDGGLYPVNTATTWTLGWNVATCARGRAHTPPDPDCRCGFYVYFHPEYNLAGGELRAGGVCGRPLPRRAHLPQP